jgi:hypothetical protein
MEKERLPGLLLPNRTASFIQPHHAAVTSIIIGIFIFYLKRNDQEMIGDLGPDPDDL